MPPALANRIASPRLRSGRLAAGIAINLTGMTLVAVQLGIPALLG